MTSMVTKIPDWQTLSPQQLHAALSEIVETRLPADATKNETAWATGARGLRDFGPGSEGWGGMIAKLHDLGYSDVANQLTYGMDFGDPQTQSMIDQLGMAAPDVFTPERVEILKSWGVYRRTRWGYLGGVGEVPDLPTITEMQQTAIHAARVTNATALFSERMQPGDDPAVVMATAWEDAA